MSTPRTLLLSVVTHLLDDRNPARLLALGDAAAVLAMPDNSLMALFTPAFGEPEAIGAKLRSIVEGNPGAHLKLVLVGGGSELREQLPRSGGLLSRRAVQQFQLLREDGGWSLWTGGGARPDSPVGQALQAAGRGELPAPDPEALRRRVDPPAPLSPEERTQLAEGQAFVAGLRVRPRATLGLLAALVVIFALEELWGGSETVPTLVRMGGNTDATLGGEPWRLLSSALLHAGWFHVAVNGFVLLVLGGFVEKVFGAARYGVLLGAAAVGGSLASAILSPAPLSVGASGAIWGVLGAAAALSWRPQGVIPEAMVGSLRRNAMINLVINLAASFHPQVDLWAHLGGGLVGAGLVLGGVLTWGMPRWGDGVSSTRARRGFVIAAGLVVGLATASLAAAWSTGRPWLLTAERTAWTQHVLGPVALEAPALLGEPTPVSVPAGASAWTLGDPLRDPMVLTVEVEPHGFDPAALARRIRAFEAGAGPEVPAEARVTQPWHRLERQGPATFALELTYEDGPRVSLLLQVHDDVDVWIRGERWPALASTWASALQRVHASLEAAPGRAAEDVRGTR